MKEFSQEKIEIAGKEYTLFLNRKGIIAFETFVKQEQEKIQDISKKLLSKNLELKTKVTDNNTNPFEDEDVVEVENLMDETKNANTKIYQKMYWILLYTNHKLSQDEVAKLYETACDEYGEEQIVALADQMVEDANKNMYEKEKSDKELKKLTALRPKK